MNSHIEITGTASRYAARMRSLVDQMRTVQELSQQQKDIGDQIAMGGDWAALATELGVTAAEAEAVYNLLGSANTELHGTFITQMVAVCG